MNKNFFIMGAPNAGKSTYLAALWYSINQKEVPTMLTLNKMIGDVQYLYRLEEKWLDVEQLERTVIGQEVPKLSVSLADNNNNILKLEFPDLSGETFQNIYELREMSQELHDLISKSDAILYFINIVNIYPLQFISEIPEHLRNKHEEIKERKPSQHDPTQVQIIDLLQAISEIKHKKIKLGIIFSAWDLLGADETMNPKEFLKQHMNMLWQYMEANTNKFEVNIWGVSALGGKIEDYEKLINIEDQVNRIKVVNEENINSHDITSIIAEMSGESYDN
ncbi:MULTISPECIES: GTPase [Clostridia]|uniref:TRAFAC clade GTPase domain-containing protein n=1 Tax=Clostridia TaxID=186801 RepID=UPI00067EBB16|nr:MULTISPECIES: GTPase [Clostridia]